MHEMLHIIINAGIAGSVIGLVFASIPFLRLHPERNLYYCLSVIASSIFIVIFNEYIEAFIMLILFAFSTAFQTLYNRPWLLLFLLLAWIAYIASNLAREQKIEKIEDKEPGKDTTSNTGEIHPQKTIIVKEKNTERKRGRHRKNNKG